MRLSPEGFCCGSRADSPLAETVAAAAGATLRFGGSVPVAAACGVVLLPSVAGGPGLATTGATSVLRAARSCWAFVIAAPAVLERNRKVTGRVARFKISIPSSYGISSMPEPRLSPSSRRTSLRTNVIGSRSTRAACSVACVPGLTRASCRPRAASIGTNLRPSEPGRLKVTESPVSTPAPSLSSAGGAILSHARVAASLV